jgi:predicted transcriptional regulator
LKKVGRKSMLDYQKKKSRSVSMSDLDWEEVTEVAKKLGLTPSDMLKRFCYAAKDRNPGTRFIAKLINQLTEEIEKMEKTREFLLRLIENKQEKEKQKKLVDELESQMSPVRVLRKAPLSEIPTRDAVLQVQE